MSEPAASVPVLSRETFLRAFLALVREGTSGLPSRTLFVSENASSPA